MNRGDVLRLLQGNWYDEDQNDIIPIQGEMTVAGGRPWPIGLKWQETVTMWSMSLGIGMNVCLIKNLSIDAMTLLLLPHSGVRNLNDCAVVELKRRD